MPYNSKNVKLLLGDCVQKMMEMIERGVKVDCIITDRI